MKNLLVLFLFLTTSSFAQQKEFSWLVGTWQEENKQAFEVWKNDNDFLSAESYYLKDGNKVTTEEVKLIKKGKEFYYVPDVAGPQGAIEFKITSLTANSFVAENPTHDFPKKITYEKIDVAHLKASIGDANKTISYSFVKVK